MLKEDIREVIIDLINKIMEEDNSSIEITDMMVINASSLLNTGEINRSETLSSIQLVTIIVSIENKFHIEISDEEMISFTTVSDLVDIVDKIINS